jgi:hypothetical protein
LEFAPLPVHHQTGLSGLIDRDAERAHRLNGTLAVMAWKKSPDSAGAVGNCGQQYGAVRDALITGNNNFRFYLWSPKNA